MLPFHQYQNQGIFHTKLNGHKAILAISIPQKPHELYGVTKLKPVARKIKKIKVKTETFFTCMQGAHISVA